MRIHADEFREHLPFIQTLFNPGMRDRHWALVSEIVGYEIIPSPEMSLAKMLTMDLQKFIPKFESVAESASKEYTLERALTRMKAEWEAVSVKLICSQCFCGQYFCYVLF